MLFLPLTTSDLDRILANPKLEGAIVSAIVTDLDGRTIFQHNAGLHVVPASNQKLLSNSFALWALGPDYRPKTSFWKLEDRIVIDAPGDPIMSYTDLQKARQSLDIRRRVPVYVHEAYAPEIPDSWEIDDLPNRFAAPVTSLTFDQGGFEAWCKHGKAVLVPESFGVRIETVSGKGRPTIQYDPFTRIVRVSGSLPIKDQRLDTMALPRPDEAAAMIFGGSMKRVTDLPTRPPDFALTGGSTQDMVLKCLPPSDNNIAENLLLMAARTEGDLGSRPYDVARKRAENFLNRVVGLVPGDVHVFDGSGLSRHNYVTARAIAKLLSWANTQKTASFWRSALAHPGAGTLASRLKGLTFYGKTGSLDMVASLSGYLTTRSGKNLIVSVILNEYSCSASEARGIQDEFIEALAND